MRVGLVLSMSALNQSINVTPVAMKLKRLMPAIHCSQWNLPGFARGGCRSVLTSCWMLLLGLLRACTAGIVHAFYIILKY
jgi:hypothetical protein